MSPKQVANLLEQSGYVTDDSLATLVWMAMELDRPLLLEGEAGVGKTAIALALSTALQRPLFRLQCHESLDLNQAVYEWNYSKQLLEIRLREAENSISQKIRHDLFSEEFLLKRPLLQAISSDQPAVLLIDEIDRAMNRSKHIFWKYSANTKFLFLSWVRLKLARVLSLY